MLKKPINKKTRLVLEKISQSDLVEKFYLAGGTALAMALEHRESIDLDWFCQTGFSNQEIKAKLSKVGNFKVINESEGTVNGLVDEVRVSFLRYQYKLIFPLAAIGKIKLADERDIAAMKIDAISSRGSKKDFIDIFFLLKKYSLEELIGFFKRKYAEIDYNRLHILKSLVYFVEADNEPMPIMIKDVNWEEVKKEIGEKVNKLVKT
ncbi:MAG: nucleotidyl transferase AbiEii/AbiGii toxin family protein [Patescibacteria group bacterium]|nr:nucleotidyl transferase AbiEii/AbiGii toxin family protein [Patescibacteria group bacterium]